MSIENEKLKNALVKNKTLGNEIPEEDIVTPEETDFQKIEKPGFLGTVVGFIKVKIFGLSDPSYEKYTKIKKVHAKIKSLPLNVFNFRHETVTKKFGKVLFELYRYIYPLKELINIRHSKSTEARVKEFFVEYYLTDKQRELFETLKEDGLKEIVKVMGVKKSSEEINNTFTTFQKSFKAEIIHKINLNYSVLLSINDLINFDLYPVIKKFCHTLNEDNIYDPPAFKNVDGKMFSEDFKNLCFALYSIDMTYDMKEPFAIIGEMKGSPIMSDDDITKFQSLIQKMISNDYLTLLVQIIDENPFYRPVYNFKEINIFSEFFKNLSKDIKTMLDGILKGMKHDKIKMILNKLFNSSEFKTLENYTDEKSDVLYKRGVMSFKYTKPMNYLKKFLMEVYNRYIRENVNTILVDGNFLQKNVNKELSSVFYSMNELMKEIMIFDEEYLGEEQMGARLKKLLPTVMRDKQILVLANKEIDEINDKALEILNSSMRSFSELMSLCKLFVEEYQKNSTDILGNIKTIGGSDNKEFIEKLARTYNDVQAINALIKFCINQ